jgi:predicted glycogen debranching enzyme
MSPAPGGRKLAFVGDRALFSIRDALGRPPGNGWRAFLRANLGRAQALRAETLAAHAKGVPFAGNSWRDIPMEPGETAWTLDMALTEPGFFKAKAYLLDPNGWQHWPGGPDFGVSVHPDFCRTANTIYCAFPRMFGAGKSLAKTPSDDPAIRKLDEMGYSVIPPSGKLRDLTRELPHIVQRLGCRVLHLLPVNPAPTTYARFGRFGSPYAAMDMAAIDPALVVFDKKTTGVDQFREMTFAAHSLGARVFLDMVVNHTGWGSVFQEEHPEWFLRKPDGKFKSPGAWGNTWEDLVELKHVNVELWESLAEVFLTWCRRGVDGFRCDAGYMVPVPAWQYIIAAVQQEFPNAIFLLEGLGGAWEATEALLTEGGMQWAYSELFQNYAGPQLAEYLDHSIKKSREAGLLVHYSETHDNTRLAAKGRAWSLLRNRLCALASDSGGFGFTCGVEWLASEKLLVHGSSGMNWGAGENIIEELARLNHLLASHPCFFDGARVERVSPPESAVVALLRADADGGNAVLALANTDLEKPRGITLKASDFNRLGISLDIPAVLEWKDLLGQPNPGTVRQQGKLTFTLAPAAVCCLGRDPEGLAGQNYRDARARAAWAIEALSRRLPVEMIGPMPWVELAALVDADPGGLLAAALVIPAEDARKELGGALRRAMDGSGYRPVVEWSFGDARRVTPVPPGHWLLIRDDKPFRARLGADGIKSVNLESTPLSSGNVAVVPPREGAMEATLQVERYNCEPTFVVGRIRYLDATPVVQKVSRDPRPEDVVLLTNDRGGMARVPLNPGAVFSKYDCVLGANLHPELPVDRHVLAKRVRVWVNADGFLSPLGAETLASFQPGPPAAWQFVAHAGDGRSVEIEMLAAMVRGRNTTVFQFRRPSEAAAKGKQLAQECDVRLTIRLDIEDRSFHSETHRNGGAEHHFTLNTRPLPNGRDARHGSGEWRGFTFTPAPDRRLRAYATSGCFHPQEEWSTSIPHPLEQGRGQVGAGDAWSPGWFEIAVPKGSSTTLVVTADPEDPGEQAIDEALQSNSSRKQIGHDDFTRVLAEAADAFVVRRGKWKTVIAGYPWFLDWGRDTFIAARGLIAAGRLDEVRNILKTFARFEHKGTLPNTIHGEDASNRDTSDAPLWFGIVCEELCAPAPVGLGSAFLSAPADVGGRTVLDVIESIAEHYVSGTPNGIRMDAASGLVWSPAHFTWMDTNYPAATPREGYPVEIQALWVRLLRFLGKHSLSRAKQWEALAAQALASIERLYWIEEKGWFSDVLLAASGCSAEKAVRDDALRSNACFLVSLGVVSGERAKRTVCAAARHLLVPGALRSLAPLPVSVPLAVRGAGGHPLNDPHHPYWGRYEGDEDTRRKPAYHNGTAWVWTLPTFCEALARAWDFDPQAVAASMAYLASTSTLLQEGCIGHLPEILDGDAPHAQRGCDAQAWSATEALRVWTTLRSPGCRAPGIRT